LRFEAGAELGLKHPDRPLDLY